MRHGLGARRAEDAAAIRGLSATAVVARVPTANYRQPTNSIGDLLQYAAETQLTVLQTRRVSISTSLAEQLAGIRPHERRARVLKFRGAFRTARSAENSFHHARGISHPPCQSNPCGPTIFVAEYSPSC